MHQMVCITYSLGHSEMYGSIKTWFSSGWDQLPKWNLIAHLGYNIIVPVKPVRIMAPESSAGRAPDQRLRRPGWRSWSDLSSFLQSCSTIYHIMTFLMKLHDVHTTQSLVFLCSLYITIRKMQIWCHEVFREDL